MIAVAATAPAAAAQSGDVFELNILTPTATVGQLVLVEVVLPSTPQADYTRIALIINRVSGSGTSQAITPSGWTNLLPSSSYAWFMPEPTAPLATTFSLVFDAVSRWDIELHTNTSQFILGHSINVTA